MFANERSKQNMKKIKQTKITSATKKWAIALDECSAGYCIHVFRTAMRSAKWPVADIIPTKSWTGFCGRGGDFHLSDISSTCWAEKLGWEVGREVAYTECMSTSPLIVKPVASSRVNPCKGHSQISVNINRLQVSKVECI